MFLQWMKKIIRHVDIEQFQNNLQTILRQSRNRDIIYDFLLSRYYLMTIFSLGLTDASEREGGASRFSDHPRTILLLILTLPQLIFPYYCEQVIMNECSVLTLQNYSNWVKNIRVMRHLLQLHTIFRLFQQIVCTDNFAILIKSDSSLTVTEMDQKG